MGLSPYIRGFNCLVLCIPVQEYVRHRRSVVVRMSKLVGVRGFERGRHRPETVRHLGSRRKIWSV